MQDDDDAYAVDVDFEIAGIKLEIEDSRRDQKWAGWFGVAGIVILFVFGPIYLDRTDMFTGGAAIFVLLGIKDHLYRNRLRQAHDQLVNLNLWAQSELQSSRRVMRIVHAMDDLPPSRDKV